MATPKKRKSDDEDNNPTVRQLLTTPKRKKSVINEEDILDSPQLMKYGRNSKPIPLVNKKIQQEESLKYIEQLLKVSTKYSSFIRSKIINPKMKERVLTEKGQLPTNNNEPVQFDITNHLKYFENGSLRDYQIEGVTWLTSLYQNGINGILADEMGLGKTIQVIALFCHLYEREVTGPFLIVAPMSTLGNWMTEFKRFAPKIPVVRVQGLSEDRKEQKDDVRMYKFEGRKVFPVVITSYEGPRLEYGFFRRFNWKYLVVDEGQRIKNPHSQLSLELRALKSDNRLLLTGTPIQNHISELWALFNFLMPELFNDQDRFSLLLQIEDIKDKDELLKTEEKMNIISRFHLALSPFILRREKKYVLKDLVPKACIDIFCPMTAPQMRIYESILAKNLALLEEPEVIDVDAPRSTRRCTTGISYNLYEMPVEELEELLNTKKRRENRVAVSSAPRTQIINRITLTNSIMMLKQVADHPYLALTPCDPNSKTRQLLVNEELITKSGKMMVLDAILPKLKAKGHKVLLFSTLCMVLDLIEEFLIMRNHKYVRLDGSKSFEYRQVKIEEFNKDPEIFIFLISTRAGGLGLNLTAADTVIFMDRDWNPMADIQAQDRCHRIGQTKPVVVYTLVSKNTIDEEIIKRGEMKTRLEKIILKEGEFRSFKDKPLVQDRMVFLKDLQNLLNSEKFSTKVHSNGLLYSNKELDRILDRTRIFEKS